MQWVATYLVWRWCGWTEGEAYRACLPSLVLVYEHDGSAGEGVDATKGDLCKSYKVVG